MRGGIVIVGGEAVAGGLECELDLAIASYCLAMADRVDQARAQMATLLATYPGYRIDDFLAGMRFDAEGEALFRAAARKIAGR